MKKKAAGTERKQEATARVTSVAMQQLMLPLVLAILGRVHRKHDRRD